MIWTKRPFDFFCATVLTLLVSPILAYFAWKVWRQGDGPIFYLAERMKTPAKSFKLIKFRTMREEKTQDRGVTGSDKNDRITPLGRSLRARRLDELPQLLNVIKGDLSFVGPRPPLRQYVEQFPEIYGEVLKSQPGITGLATLKYHPHEDRLLRQCHTAAETEETYTKRCIPAKARLDLIYQKNFTPCFDYWIIYKTLEQTFGRRKNGQSR